MDFDENTTNRQISFGGFWSHVGPVPAPRDHGLPPVQTAESFLKNSAERVVDASHGPW